MGLALDFLVDSEKRHSFSREVAELLADADSRELSILERVNDVIGTQGGSLPQLRLDRSIYSLVGSYRWFNTFRALAAYLEVHDSIEGFDPYREGRHPELTAVYEGTRDTLRFTQLLRHSDCSGWYHPAEFGEPLRLDGVSHDFAPGGVFTVGSSPALLYELHDINRVLQVPDGFLAAWLDVREQDPERFGPTRAEYGDVLPLASSQGVAVPGNGVWDGLRYTWAVLEWYARVSVKDARVIRFC